MKLTPVSNDLKKYTKSDPDLSFVKKKTILISNSFRLLKSPIHFQRLLSVENRPRFHWPDRYITEKANNSFELLKPIKQRWKSPLLENPTIIRNSSLGPNKDLKLAGNNMKPYKASYSNNMKIDIRQKSRCYRSALSAYNNNREIQTEEVYFL